MYVNIEAERKRSGLTQEEFVQKIGISRKTYYLWQLKEEFPSSVLLKISNLFNCSIDYLLGMKKTPNIKK